VTQNDSYGKTEKYEDLALAISNWAKLSEIKDSEIIQEILESFSAKKISKLNHLIPFQESLPEPKSNLGSSLIKVGKWIAILRNAIIFAPVALTWKAVSEATESFAIYAEQNKNVPVNFLAFWQNGYGYLDNFWKIGHVAELDFQLILLVISLTLISVFTIQRGQFKKNKAIENLRDYRHNLAFRLNRLVGSRVSLNNSQINEIVIDSIVQLGGASEDLLKVSKNLLTTNLLLSENLSKISESLSILDKSVVELKVETKNFASEVQGLAQSMDSSADRKSLEKLLTNLKMQIESYISK